MTQTDAPGLGSKRGRRGDTRCLCSEERWCGISPAPLFLHRSLGPAFVLSNSEFKCSLPHGDGDSDSVHVSVHSSLPSCKL